MPLDDVNLSFTDPKIATGQQRLRALAELLRKPLPLVWDYALGLAHVEDAYVNHVGQCGGNYPVDVPAWRLYL